MYCTAVHLYLLYVMKESSVRHTFVRIGYQARTDVHNVIQKTKDKSSSYKLNESLAAVAAVGMKPNSPVL